MMAVNLSARQFRDGNLPQLVQTVLAETDLQPTSLELEITESMLIESRDEVSERLHTLRKLGVSVAVVYFGTGFSSLSYLTQFPISTLKIDRSFISKMIGSKSDTAVVQAIVAIAKSMELKVIAEGVETIDQLQYLQQHICNIKERSLDPTTINDDSFQIQGYLINEALPLGQIEKNFQTIHRRSAALVHSGIKAALI
jgi:EAL domain-containing protein (putative c-di-GMP-specific phosphodiesterase class I)